MADATSPDVALAGSEESYSHRNLFYPLGRRGPAAGEVVPLAPGLGWARLPLPGPLRHINVWLLDDGEGLTLVDTGFADAASRDAWAALLSGPGAGRPVTAVVVTHFHPDHVGLAGWLTRRCDAPLFMTRTEYLMARMLAAEAADTPPDESAIAWRRAGWSDERITAERAKGWSRFAALVSPVPKTFQRLVDGQALAIGDRVWRVVVGSGHSPEHACLLDEPGGLLIAGDQVLPRITSNVSLSLAEPEADPLGEWLASIAKLRVLPNDLLVLPAHGEPFTGLHERLDALADGHCRQLDTLHTHLMEPRRAVDCFATLFARGIDDSVYGLATGEALAHLRHLEVTARAVREERDGVWWFRAA